MTYSSRNFLISCGVGQRRAGAAVLEPVVVRDDVVADLDALVADEDRRAGDQLADVVLVLVAEGAPEDLGLAGLLYHARLSLATASIYARFRMTSSIIPYSFP